MDMTTAIISHGRISDFKYHKDILEGCDYIICADGGAFYAKEMGIEPDIILGDFDSLDNRFLKAFGKAKVLRFPAEKDKTDTELAVDHAIDRGEQHILLLGATGSRLDHTMANISLLKLMLDKGVKGEIINENNRAILIKDWTTVKGKGTYVSLIPFGSRVTGVTLKGFKYPLNNEVLELGSSRGISNVLNNEVGEIKIKSGLLLVVLARD
jgi:thiamine pyrophosphokinase